MVDCIDCFSRLNSEAMEKWFCGKADNGGEAMTKRFFRLLLTICIIWLLDCNVGMRADASGRMGESAPRIIYIVYDNSSSTYIKAKKTRDYWSAINYGVQAFYAMTNAEDTVKFYFTSYPSGTSYESMAYGGYDRNNSKNMMDQIKAFKIMNSPSKSVTDIRQVEKAINDIARQGGAEKWVVIFSDGDFEEVDGNGKVKKLEPKVFSDRLSGYLEGKGDIKVCYIPIGMSSGEWEVPKGVFVPGNTDIDKQLLEVCQHIYNRRAVSEICGTLEEVCSRTDNTLTIRFSIPISGCLLYVYCDGQVEGDLAGNDILWQEHIKSPDEMAVFLQNGDDTRAEKIGKTGYIVELAADPGKSAPTYKIDFPEGVSGMEYEIYYEPAYEIRPWIVQGNDNFVEGKYPVGDYEIELDFYNRESGEALSAESVFLSGETFSLTVDGKKTEGLSYGGGAWSGASDGGMVEIEVSVPGITGVAQGEFVKDYASMELRAELDDKYNMDVLDEKSQYVKLQAYLDGENVTQEVEELLEHGGATLVCRLNKDGKEYSRIGFERNYDPSGQCWKMYPVFADGVDYSMAGDYEFEAEASMDLEYYKQPVKLEWDELGTFTAGISDGELMIDVEQPWECEVKVFFGVWATKKQLTFYWNGEELPEEALKELTLACTTDTDAYDVEIRNRKLALKKGFFQLFFLEGGADGLTLEGSVTLFGVRKPLEARLEMEVRGLSAWDILFVILEWLSLLVLTLSVVVPPVRHIIGVKRQERFSFRTKVYRSFDKKKFRVRGSIGRRRRRDKYKRVYAHYILRCRLPKSIGGERLKIDVCRKKDRLEIIDMKKPAGCEKIMLGNREYRGSNNTMYVDQDIQLKFGKRTILIFLENVL